VAEVRKWSYEIDTTTLGFDATRKANALMKVFLDSPSDPSPLGTLEEMLRALEPLSLNLDLSNTQNIIFSTGRRLSSEMRERAEQGDDSAREWLERLERLADYLRVRSN
jgi:hypothetical protein